MGIVIESIDDAISFFSEIGLKLEGRATIEGEWSGRVTGLHSQKVEIAMMVTLMVIADLRFHDFSPRQLFQTIERPLLIPSVIYALCSLLKTLTSWLADLLNMEHNL